MFAILKREFKAYFQSVIGWLFVAALLAIFGLYFYVYNLRSGYPYLSYTLSAITIVFLIAVPIIQTSSEILLQYNYTLFDITCPAFFHNFVIHNP